MHMVELFLALFPAYWLGSVPFAYLVVRLLKKTDIRAQGSGNVGATNVFRVAGPAAGMAVAFLDVMKGFCAVALCDILAPNSTVVARLAAGMLAIAGHNWPLWLGFKGGRGVLTTAGVFLYLAWLPTVLSLAVFGVVFGISRYVSLGSLSAVTAFPALIILLPGHFEPILLAAGAAAAAVVYLRHIPNIKRLIGGNEYRFGDRKAGQRKI